MPVSAKTLNSKSFITQQSLQKLGYIPAMQIAGADIAAALRSSEQEFTLRPRVTPDVHLLKFRTVMTNRELIVRYSPRRPDLIIFRFIEHRDRFSCDTTTRQKVKEIQFDLSMPNLARRIMHVVHYDAMPWLKLSSENLRKPSIRLPVKRNSIEAKSRFLPASFAIDHFSVQAGSDDAKIVLFSQNKELSFAIEMQENLLTRLQDPRNKMHLVIFASGNYHLIDETMFLREFVYVDEIEVPERHTGQEVY